MLNKWKKNSKKGFTLIELVVIMLALSILAAAGTAAYNGMILHFTERACIDSRTEAAQSVVSACLQGEISIEVESIKVWLANYPYKNQTKENEHWEYDVQESNGKIEVKIRCTKHSNETITRIISKPLT